MPINPPISHITKYSVSLSEKALLPIFQQEQSKESAQVFTEGSNTEILDEMGKETLRRKDLTESVLLGELHKQYITYSLTNPGKGCITIVDDGTHQCSSKKCTIVPVNGNVYCLPNHRAHVCLEMKGHQCPAPAKFHVGASRPLQNLLFCCEASGKSHVCTPELCTAPQENRDGQVYCQLSGKALRFEKPSHGWIEDNWRPVLKKQRATVKPKSGLKGQKDNPSVTRCTLEKLACFPKAGDSLALEQYIKTFTNANRHSFKVVRSLMNGSPERNKLESKNVQRVQSKVTNLWHRHAKQCMQKQEQIDMCALHLMLRRELETISTCPVPIDNDRMNRLCQAYATHASAYVVQLLKYTNLSKQDVNFTDCIVALLYLQCNRFRLKGTIIIDTDPFLLQCLPPACNLGDFPLLRRNNFTNTKTSIQASIIEACETGIGISSLQMPMIQIEDLI